MKKNLKDLDLLDRFLFAEAMEDSETMQMVLEIILGRDILMKYDPQPEKEQRTFPLKKYIKLDVWAQDMEETVYDTEVQKRDTGNLPKRSRFYQGVIDSGLLKSGEADFNQMSNVFIIVIMPFDLFGKGRYMYTFQMGAKKKKTCFCMMVLREYFSIPMVKIRKGSHRNCVICYAIWNTVMPKPANTVKVIGFTVFIPRFRQSRTTRK